MLTDHAAKPRIPTTPSVCARRQDRPSALPERQRHRTVGSTSAAWPLPTAASMPWTIVPHSIASGWRSTESHRPWERGHPARCLGSRPLPLWHGRDAPAPAGRMPALHPPSRDAPPWVTSATPRLRCALTGVYSCPPEDLKGRPGSRELACVTFPTRRLSCRNSARPTMHFDLALAVASSEFKYPLSSCLCQNGEPHASYGRSTELTNNISRRTFMVGAATAAAAMRVWGANDRIRLGIIGSGQRGQYLMSRANEVGGY